jgi:hypothetical protein
VLIHQALGFEFTDTIKIIIISSEIIKWILEIQILIRKKKKKEKRNSNSWLCHPSKSLSTTVC